MKSKRIFSAVLSLAMAVSAFSSLAVTASAESTKKTMNMGGSVIAVKDNIYYGYNDGAKKWRVLSTNGNTTSDDTVSFSDGTNTVSADKALFVISENDFEQRAFNSNYSQNWQQSEAQAWCNEIGDNYKAKGFYTAAGITDTEKAAILTTSKTDAEYGYLKATSINDKVFYLSAKEADTYLTDKIFKPGGEDAVWWWLRSPSKDGGNVVGFLKDNGNLAYAFADYSLVASRPAFNLNLSSVLFTSAANFNGTVESYDGNEWKLTLKDSTRSITIGDVARDGNKVTVNYSGATTGTNAKVAYIVTNADKTEIKAYGNADTTGSGSIDVTISDDTNKIFVFSEQDNGAKKTNYASELKEVTIPADGFAVTANVNDSDMGSVTSSKEIAKAGESVTLTATANEGYKLVGFTADGIEIGVTGNKGIFEMPEKDVTVTANFTAISGENTITVAPNFSGMGTASADLEKAKFGDLVTLTAVANKGNTFVSFVSPQVEIGEDGKFIMPDEPVYVRAIFKAEASFVPDEQYSIQAQKNPETSTAVLRFMWKLNKNDGAYISNIGAYIIPWEFFGKDKKATPSIVTVQSPNLEDGETFSADYIDIPEGAEYSTNYCAIPFINGTFFGNAYIVGNVNEADIELK